MELLEHLLGEYHAEIIGLAVSRIQGETNRDLRIKEALVSTAEQAIIDHVTSLVEAAKKEGGENG